jgi:hypothetical protein
VIRHGRPKRENCPGGWPASCWPPRRRRQAARLSIVSFRIRHGAEYLHHNFVVALLNDLFGVQARGRVLVRGSLRAPAAGHPPALLALSPGGLDLGELHARLYGDRPVSPGTLKAEMPQLRAVLGGRLTSRPYRIDTCRCAAMSPTCSTGSGPVTSPALRSGTAVSSCPGRSPPRSSNTGTSSPWRAHCAVVRPAARGGAALDRNRSLRPEAARTVRTSGRRPPRGQNGPPGERGPVSLADLADRAEEMGGTMRVSTSDLGGIAVEMLAQVPGRLDE